ncbi:MAG: Slp family lipoprotein [Lysobacterales bacterium]
MSRLTCTAGLAILATLSFSACTTIPEQLKGDYVALSPENTTEKELQTPVRWGGVILETRPESEYTCFEILARELQTSMRPQKSDQANGRFIACKPGFYDPEVFKKGREVTVTGKVIHIDVRKVGDYDYHFPVVDFEFMILWPKRRDRVYYGMYRPYYWHYPYYGPYWRYPYYR